MRRFISAGLCVVALSVMTCKSLTTIQVSQNATATVPKATFVESVLGDVAFTGFDNFDLSQNETLKNQGVSKNEINSVKLKTFTLTITAPPGQDFSFLQSVQFSIATAGQPTVVIASGQNFAAGATQIGLDVQDVELAPYVAASSMSITSTVSGHPPPNDTTIAAQVVFDVDVNLKGALCGG